MLEPRITSVSRQQTRCLFSIGNFRLPGSQMSQRGWINVHNWPESPCQAVSFPSCPQQPRQTDLDRMEGWQRVLPGSARAGTGRCARSPGRSPGAPGSRSRCSPASSPAGCSWDPPPRNPPRTAPIAGAGADAC